MMGPGSGLMKGVQRKSEGAGCQAGHAAQFSGTTWQLESSAQSTHAGRYRTSLLSNPLTDEAEDEAQQHRHGVVCRGGMKHQLSLQKQPVAALLHHGCNSAAQHLQPAARARS